jgi:peptide/nickel transport system permease protein
MYRNKLAVAGSIVLLGLLIAALGASLLSPYDPAAQDLPAELRAPCWAHPFGQDKLGRDILSRIIYGARVSLLVGGVTVAVSAVVGLSVGIIAGYAGGVLDETLMRLTDIMLAFPGILLAIALMAIRGPGLNNVLIALCIMGWVGYARLARGQILSIRHREYVHAARSLGATPTRIMTRHLLPNIMAPIIVEATFGMAGAILAEAGLSFLGLGTQPPTPSWGTMLNEGRQFLLVAPHLTTFPGLAIMVVVLGLNFLGDGLRDAIDPRRLAR